MACVCIVYEPEPPGQPWPAMDKALQDLGAFHGFGTTWFLETEETPEQVIQHIEHLAEEDDKLMAFTATQPARWRGVSVKLDSWLKEKL